jgi:hypothetical protein
MNKLSSIQRDHLLQAADILDQERHFNPSDYWIWVKEKQREYPFKQLVLLAYEQATSIHKGRDFFQSSPYYRNYISKEFEYPIISPNPAPVPFFNMHEIEYFAQHAENPYRRNAPDHRVVGAQLKKTIIPKTAFWAHASRLEGFIVEPDNFWQRRGSFVGYTWARIYRIEDPGKVFFTVGIDLKKNALVYKLDCQHTAANKIKKLTPAEKETFDRVVDASDMEPQLVLFDSIEYYDWNRLIEETRKFIEYYTPLYDEVIEAIWDPVLPGAPVNSLRAISAPDGRSELPGGRKRAYARNVDYEKDQKIKKEYGDRGEELVLERERQLVNIYFPKDPEKEVKKVLDWWGYDILSYYPDGRPKYVEVKTTVGSRNQCFFLSKNERQTMAKNPDHYCLYRLCNFDKLRNSADFYVLEGDLTDRLHFQPVQYKVFLRAPSTPRSG